MSLKDVLDSFQEDPEEVKRTQLLEEELDSLKARIQSKPDTVTDAEIVEGIRKQFDLFLSSDFLDEASWLMDALSFTKALIPIDQTIDAWDRFQKSHSEMCEFTIEEYPILEGIAQWYFEHRQDPGREEVEMVTRSLSAYEYLLWTVLGIEASPRDETLLAEIGPTVMHLYCWVGNFERAKFYAQLLESEYKAGRLQEQDYLQIAQSYELILIKERGESITSVEKELHKINRTWWDTISDRDLQIDRLTEENARLLEKVAEADHPQPLTEARKRLEARYSAGWVNLQAETRRFLELGEMFSREPFSSQSPGSVPTYAYQALKTELLFRLAQPRGALHPEVLRKAKNDPIKLLLTFQCDPREQLSREDREAIRKSLCAAFGRDRLLKGHNLRMLKLLKDHRDQAQHPEDRASYTKERLGDFIDKIWNSGWLLHFLL